MRTDQNAQIGKKELVPNGQKKEKPVCRRVLEKGDKEVVGNKVSESIMKVCSLLYTQKYQQNFNFRCRESNLK